MRLHLPAGVLIVSLLFTGSLRADEPKSSKPAPAPDSTKPAPLTVDDLRALETQVQAVVAKVRPATVGVAIGPSQGSGVIVKGGYVLTAGHVSGQPGREAILSLADGRRVKGKTLGRNGGIDSGLIKITEEGKWPSAEMGKSAGLKQGQWVVCIGHPGGFRPTRTPVVRLGRVLDAGDLLIRTDCTLVGGDSGGPLFDLDGKVVGINSRINAPITVNIHVPVDTYSLTWGSLARSKVWGERGVSELVQSPGGEVVLDKKEKTPSETTPVPSSGTSAKAKLAT
jgi:serine protease Do